MTHVAWPVAGSAPHGRAPNSLAGTTWEGPRLICRGFKPDPGNLAVREFQSIVMGAGIVQVDLPEPRDFVRERPRVPPEYAELESAESPFRHLIKDYRAFAA